MSIGYKKCKHAITAGIVGGIILAIISFFSLVIFRLIFPWEMPWLVFVVILLFILFITQPSAIQPSASHSNDISFLIPCVIAFLILVVSALVFFLTGLLASKLASKDISNIFDAIMLGFVAGVIAEIILLPSIIFFELIYLVFFNFVPFFFYGEDIFLEAHYGGITIWPIFLAFIIILGIAFSLMGALIYYQFRKKGLQATK